MTLKAPPSLSSDASLNLITRAANLGIWDWDLLNRTYIYSPRAREICGFTPEQAVTVNDLRRVTHPDDLPRAEAMVRQALDPGMRAVTHCEYRLILADRSERWVVAHGEAMFAMVDGVERAVRYIGALQDVTEQRLLARAERTAKHRLRMAIEAGHMAVWDYDLTSHTLTGSPELNRLMGFPEDAAPSADDIATGYLPGEGERLREIVQASVAEDRSSIEAEFRYRRPDGVARWLMLRATIDYDSERRPAKLVGVLTDVTAQKAGETALIESQARFRIIADSAPAPLWMTAAAGGLEFVNQAFANLAGLEREAVTGDVWLQLLHPDDLAAVVSKREEARKRNAAYDFEARFRNAQGEYRSMLAYSKPRFGEGGVFEGYVGMAVDVTDMRRAEHARRESEARFRLMAEDSPVMLWMGDETGHCVYLNRAQRAFWGVSEDLEGFSWSETLYPEDRDGLFAAFSAAMAREQSFEVEARYIRADGAIRWLTTRAHPRRDADGRFLGMIGVNTDDTDYREAQTRQRLLINELNHRVKNTLASVQSIVRQSLREGVPVARARHVLIERLMALSSAHNVLTQRNWESAGLKDVVTDALRAFEDPNEPRFDIRGGDVELSPTAVLAVAMALHELGTNAVKYGALSVAGGRVSVAWTPLDGDRAVRMEWRERGGPPVTPPAHAGFGSRLLQSGLAADLGERARLDFDPSGLVATLDIRTYRAQSDLTEMA